MLSSVPEISCLCATQPGRWGQLQRAIIDFSKQTFANSELVIVSPSPDFAVTIQSFVDRLGIHGEVQVLYRAVKAQMEALQYAQMSAHGRILTLWDDDNLNHPKRLEIQHRTQVTIPTHVTVLTKGFYFFYQDMELFVVDTFKTSAPLHEAVLPTTLMAFREHFPVIDLTVRQSPSRNMILNTVRAGKKVTTLPDSYLHLVGVTLDSHCPHVRTYAKHREIAEGSAYTAQQIATAEDSVVDALDEYHWPNAEVHVNGRDGEAINYTPKRTWDSELYPVRVDIDTPPPTGK